MEKPPKIVSIEEGRKMKIVRENGQNKPEKRESIEKEFDQLLDYLELKLEEIDKTLIPLIAKDNREQAVVCLVDFFIHKVNIIDLSNKVENIWKRGIEEKKPEIRNMLFALMSDSKKIKIYLGDSSLYRLNTTDQYSMLLEAYDSIETLLAARNYFSNK